jgi:hypothetical protein
MILIDNEWCFIHIPKTSGTNLTKIFPDERSIKYDGNELWDLFLSDNCDYFSALEKYGIPKINAIQHAPVHFWEKNNIIDNNYKIFTIVRNPYTRIVSLYNEIKRWVKKIDFSFEKFILNEKINNFFKLIFHDQFSINTNQLDFFIDCNKNIRLDKFYKLETDLKNIEIDFNIKNINTYKYNSYNYNKNYSEIFTDELIDWVQQNFKKDFEYFNYNINPFWQ